MDTKTARARLSTIRESMIGERAASTSGTFNPHDFSGGDKAFFKGAPVTIRAVDTRGSPFGVQYDVAVTFDDSGRKHTIRIDQDEESPLTKTLPHRKQNRQESMIGERGTGSAARYTMKAVADEAGWIQDKIDDMLRKLEDVVGGLVGDDAMAVEAEAEAVENARNALRSALNSLKEKARRGPIWRS